MARVRVVFVRLIASFLVALVPPVVAQQTPPQPAVIRFPGGVLFEVPQGWSWTKFDSKYVTTIVLTYDATSAIASTEQLNPNTLAVTVRTDQIDKSSAWERLDINRSQTLANGVVTQWKSGVRWNIPQFEGFATVGSKIISASQMTLRQRTLFDSAILESAFLRIAGSLRAVPQARSLFHPTLRMSMEHPDPKRWSLEATRVNFRLGCYQNICGQGSNTWILLYPTSIKFADLSAALADITGHFGKNESLKIGEVRREAIGEGEFVWTEQPGSRRPFLGVFKRGDSYFFAQMLAEKSMTATNNDLRNDYLAVARSVRSWDGR